MSLIGIWEGVTGHNPIVKAGRITYVSANHYSTTWNCRRVPRRTPPRALNVRAPDRLRDVPSDPARLRIGPWRPLESCFCWIILIAEALTYSRNAWIGCLVVVVLLAGRGRGRILGGAATILVAAAVDRQGRFIES